MKRSYLLLLLLAMVSRCGKKTTETRPHRGNIVETVFASGTLEPRHKYNLTAQSEGYIASFAADHGDIVKAGGVIAVIDNVQNEAGARSAETLYSIAAENASARGPALVQAKQNIALLFEKRNQDSVNESRYRKLFDEKSATKLQWENALLTFRGSLTNHMNAVMAYETVAMQTRQQLAQQEAQRDVSRAAKGYNTLTAPVGGKIYKRLKEAGDYVRRGEVVAVIGDDTQLYARLTVDENNIGRVQAGQKVTVSLNTAKEKNQQAVITRLLPAFDEQTQSFICEAEFRSSPQPQIAGTQLQANITTGKKANALLIPRSYLSYGNKVKVKGKGEVPVKTGFVSGDWVEVLSGLSENETIVTDAAQ